MDVKHMAINERPKREPMEGGNASKIYNELESSDKANDPNVEEKALEMFKSTYGNKVKFSASTEQKYFSNILQFLLRRRLLSSSKKPVAPSVIASLRILLREPEYLRVFAEEKGLIGLKKHMDLYIHLLSPALAETTEEMLSTALKVLGDMLNIFQKFLMKMPSRTERENVISSNIIESIAHLLNNNRDFALLQETLRLLLYMTDKEEVYIAEFFKSETIDNLLHLLEYKDLETTQLSLHLISSFLSRSEARHYIPHIPTDFLNTFTSHLTHKNVKVLEHTIWCLASCALYEDGRKRIRLTGAISLLLSILENGNHFDFMSPVANSNQKRCGSHTKRPTVRDSETVSHHDQLFDMQSACCNCLAELSCDYTSGQTIIESNGIYTLAVLLFPENKEYLKLERFHHLQRTAFKALRFLFPLDKRHEQYQCKRLFPEQIFQLFIGIGNFQRDSHAYNEIVNAWNMIPFDELAKIKLERLQKISLRQEPTGYIKDYDVYERLGSGAFGSVYRVAKQGSTTMYALKEIDNRSLDFKHDRSFGKMISEVNIIREEPRHPNIVTYYEIFAENDKLYIKMELIAGTSLQDYLTFIKASGQTVSETNIWHMFVQLTLALRYLHKEKGIVHRDLTANNIMLDDEYRVKITDFGLAKLRHNDCSLMNSVVGTMYYACPEIVQHLGYNEKADIWSLGCVLYYMLALVLPFFTPNFCLLVSKICAGDYDQAPLQKGSESIRNAISACLTVDPSCRPDICEVSRLCTQQLMSFADRSCAIIQSLERRLRRRDYQRDSMLRKQQSQIQSQSSIQHQRCLSCSSAKESLVSSGGTADISFDETEVQHDRNKQDTLSLGESTENSTNCIVPQRPSNETKPSTFRRHSYRYNSESTLCSTENMAGSTRSLESSAISSESGYSSNQVAPTINNSSGSLSVERRITSANNSSRPSSASSSICIANTRLRPTDPVSQLLDIVHKMVYISYVPKTKTKNHKYRRLIDRYRDYLFSKGTSQSLKSELSKLSAHSSDYIEFDIDIGRAMPDSRQLTNSSRSASINSLNSNIVDFTVSEGDGSITYDQMMLYIDQVLRETDYAKDASSPILPNESLPPTSQRSQRPPSGRK